MHIASNNPDPKRLHPYCPACGWRKGGVDSWDGKSCKCRHEEPAMRVWSGCTHLDCLPECVHNLDRPYCERHARWERGE